MFSLQHSYSGHHYLGEQKANAIEKGEQMFVGGERRFSAFGPVRPERSSPAIYIV